MKKKNQAPHDEIKAYLKVAQERLASALFVRPEWRKPKSVAALNVIISRINEVYYPFSDRKRPKLAVWKQVLKEKREEMIEEIEAAKENQEKENKIKASGVVKEPVRLIEPGFKGTPAAPSPSDAWTKESVAKLRENITSCRAGAKIARALGIGRPYLSHILRIGWSGKKGAEYLPKIKTAFDTLEAKKSIRRVDPVLTQLTLDYKKAELKAQFHKDDINHKNFMGQEYPQGVAKADAILSIERPERNDSEEMLELVGTIYRMIKAAKFWRCGTYSPERQVVGMVAQLIDPNLVLTRQS